MKVIISTLIGLSAISLILIITIIIVSGDIGGNLKNNKRQSPLKDDSQEQDNKAISYDSEMLGMILDINRDDNQISLYNINKQESQSLTYSGSSDIRDKFDQVILMNQLPIGSIVDVAYVKDEDRLVKINVSSKGWEYVGVSNHHIEKESMTMEIGDRRYKYNDNVLVVDQDQAVSIDHLARQDVLTVWGIDEVIWSIIVNKGHGSLRLEDYDDFFGGNITVGYEATQQVTDDLILTVREGTYSLTVENQHYSGRKSVTINRNEETLVSLEGLGPGPMDMGLIEFKISPLGADLFINNNLTTYVNPVELPYGDYNLKTSLGGYNSYEGFVKVDKARMTISIDLPEAESREDVDVDVSSEEGGATDSGYDDWEQSLGESEEGVYWDTEHYIYVQKPIGASVYLKGEFLGISPGRFPKIIGTHVMTFIKDGHETMSYTVEIGDDGLDTYISMPELIPLQ